MYDIFIMYKKNDHGIKKFEGYPNHLIGLMKIKLKLKNTEYV